MNYDRQTVEGDGHLDERDLASAASLQFGGVDRTKLATSSCPHRISRRIAGVRQGQSTRLKPPTETIGQDSRDR
jgi:hypothetical protein